MVKLSPLGLLLFLPSPVFASSFTVSDGVQSLIRILGGLLLGFINSGEYLIVLCVVFIILILFMGVFLALFVLSLNILRKFRG